MSESEPNTDNEPVDPNGDPQAVQGLTKSDLRKRRLAITAAVAPAVGVGLVLVAGSCGRMGGKIVSYDLEWQQRQAEIEQVARAESTQDTTVQDVAHD